MWRVAHAVIDAAHTFFGDGRTSPGLSDTPVHYDFGRIGPSDRNASIAKDAGPRSDDGVRYRLLASSTVRM